VFEAVPSLLHNFCPPAVCVMKKKLEPTVMLEIMVIASPVLKTNAGTDVDVAENKLSDDE
jgi:hypothetical protein